MAARKKNGIARAVSGLALALLVVVPIVFIAAGIEQRAGTEYSRSLIRDQIELQHELQRFKLDLTPRFQVEKIIREVENAAELVPMGKLVPTFNQGQDPDIYNASTLPKMLGLFSRDHGLEPVYLAVTDADVRNTFSHFSQELQHLDDEQRRRLNAAVILYLTGLIDVESVLNDAEAAERFKKLRSFVGEGYNNTSDAFYYAIRDAFSPMVYQPKFPGSTFEMATDKFDGLRIFIHYNHLRAGSKFYGGYFVVLANRRITPEYILNKALKPALKDVIRSYSEVSSDSEKRLVLQSAISSEIKGYAKVFADAKDLPENIYVYKDFSERRVDHESLLKKLAMARKLAILSALFLFIRLWWFGFPKFAGLRMKMLAIVGLSMLFPYMILGHLAKLLVENIDNIRVEEVQAEMDRFIYELQKYYADQKLQHIFRIFYAKEQLIKYSNEPAELILNLDRHVIAEPNYHLNVHFYRNDGISRRFSSGRHQERNINRFYAQMGAKYLESLGFLDKSSKLAMRDFEMSGLTDGFIGVMRQGYLEHLILQNEGFETRDITKVDDFSRKVFYLIPEASSPAAGIRGMSFASIADVNHDMYQQKHFNRGIFYRNGEFFSARLLLGTRRVDDTVGNFWPLEVSSTSSLKQLLDFSCLSHDTGKLLRIDARGVSLSGWRFEKAENSVYGCEIEALPNLSVQLMARVFPLLLLICTLISVFLFADLLNSMFVKPVTAFVEAAESIKEGKYALTIRCDAKDELAQLAKSFNLMADGLQQREKLRRFINDDLFARIQQRQEKAEAEKLQKSSLTVLASDIRNFTGICEVFAAEEIVLMLNDYFTEMETAITSSGGTIVRFVGDAVLAFFRSEDQKENALNAVKAAVKMRRFLAELNERRRNIGLFQIENGIGIASGEAMSGIAGSEKGRKVFCLIGEIVGRAENLEARSKLSSNQKILLCENTLDLCREKIAVCRLPGDKDSVYDLVEVFDV